MSNGGTVHIVKDYMSAQATLNNTVVHTNIPSIANLVNGDIYQEYKKSKKKSKAAVKSGKSKGRPELHKFPGRITFLRKEVETYINDHDLFIEDMAKAHALSEERRAILMADGIITNFVEMFYTFQGPIPMVLEEMQTVIDKYKDKASIRLDFKKVNTYTNKHDEHYVEPTYKEVSGVREVTQVEAIPDRIYGYVKVIMSKDGD